MKRAVACCLACSALLGCFDFDQLLRDCADGGKCPGADSGAGGGNASGGGSATGGGTAGGTGGGVAGGSGGGGGGFAGFAPPSAVCFQQTCWENPLPMGERVGAVWGNGPDDVWAGAGANLLLHWDGGTWAALYQQPDLSQGSGISSLTGPGPELWAAEATGPALVYDGSWTQSPGSPQNLNFISAIQTDAGSGLVVWVIDDVNAIWFYDGSFWSAKSGMSPAVTAMSADREGGLWLASDLDMTSNGDMPQPRVSHYNPDGTAHADVTLGLRPRVVGLSPLADGTALGVDKDYRVIQFFSDGGNWRDFDAGAGETADDGMFLLDGSGLAVGDALSAYARTASGAWQRVPTSPQPSTPASYQAVWTMQGLEGSWAVGESGALARYTAGAFHYYTVGNTGGLNAIAVTPTLAFAGGSEGQLLVRDGGSWTAQAFTQSSQIFSAAVSPNGRVCLGGGGFVQCWSPSGSTTTVMGTNDDANGLFVFDDGGILAATEGGQVLQRNGLNSWTNLLDAGTVLNAVVANATGDVWTGGQDGPILHRSPAGVWDASPFTANIYTFWVDPQSGQPYAGGDTAGAPMVWQLTDAGWNDVLLASDNSANTIHALAGQGVFDLWAVGENGHAYQGVGNIFTLVQLGTQVRFIAASQLDDADGGHHLFIAGDNGAILQHTY